jgi:hypothetical protein
MKAKAFIIFTLVVIAGLGAMTPWALSKAPYKHRFDECLICGRSRTTIIEWGKDTVETFETPEHSLWFDQHLPGEHKHRWYTASVESRSEWFGSELAACGGVGVVSTLYYAKTKVGAKAVQPLIAEYVKLSKNGTHQELSEFSQTKVAPLLVTKQ